jgi:hypothetical protein
MNIRILAGAALVAVTLFSTVGCSGGNNGLVLVKTLETRFSLGRTCLLNPDHVMWVSYIHIEGEDAYVLVSLPGHLSPTNSNSFEISVKDAKRIFGASLINKLANENEKEIAARAK